MGIGFPEAVIILAILAIFAFFVFALVHLVNNKRYSKVAKLFWAIALLFAFPFAVVVYFIYEK